MKVGEDRVNIYMQEGSLDGNYMQSPSIRASHANLEKAQSKVTSHTSTHSQGDHLSKNHHGSSEPSLTLALVIAVRGFGNRNSRSLGLLGASSNDAFGLQISDFFDRGLCALAELGSII
jgi:hypothetical protein